jgi:hypothetical protein
VNKRTFVSLVTLAALFVAAFGIWQIRYTIYDWAKLRNYTPTAPIAALATRSAMNSYGRTLFYINDPKLSDRTEFASQCKVREQTIVLGCYNGTGIYVFAVQDPLLKGVEEVTAAHEMLHAAYSRLSPSERKKIDSLTEAAYEKINDPELAKRIDSYKKSEPGEIPNELHSILGTEKRNLGSSLDEYYKQYFTNRLEVVTLAENYEKVFIDIQNQVQKYDADLSLRKSEIDRREAALESMANNLQSQRTSLDSTLNSKDYRAYNAQVPVYNAAVSSFNRELAGVKTIIADYNQIVQERNKLASDQENLAQSLDSRLSAIKQ